MDSPLNTYYYNCAFGAGDLSFPWGSFDTVKYCHNCFLQVKYQMGKHSVVKLPSRNNVNWQVMWFAILWLPEQITGYYVDEMGSVHFWVMGLLDTLYNWHLHYRLWWVLFWILYISVSDPVSFLVSPLRETLVPCFREEGMNDKRRMDGRVGLEESPCCRGQPGLTTKRGRLCPSWRGCKSKLGRDRPPGRPRLVVGHSCLVKRLVHRAPTACKFFLWGVVVRSWMLAGRCCCWFFAEEKKRSKQTNT